MGHSRRTLHSSDSEQLYNYTGLLCSYEMHFGSLRSRCNSRKGNRIARSHLCCVIKENMDHSEMQFALEWINGFTKHTIGFGNSELQMQVTSTQILLHYPAKTQASLAKTQASPAYEDILCE